MVMDKMDEMGKDISLVMKEAAQQMKVASGGGREKGSDGGNGDKEKKEEKNQATSLKKLAGIDISIAAMLKQSQIFTGFLGSVFQLIGMLVDVILAPLAPYLFKIDYSIAI